MACIWEMFCISFVFNVQLLLLLVLYFLINFCKSLKRKIFEFLIIYWYFNYHLMGFREIISAKFLRKLIQSDFSSRFQHFEKIYHLKSNNKILEVCRHFTDQTKVQQSFFYINRNSHFGWLHRSFVWYNNFSTLQQFYYFFRWGSNGHKIFLMQSCWLDWCVYTSTAILFIICEK